MRYSIYVTSLDPGLLDRPADPPPEYSHRSIGRPHSEQCKEGDGVRILWPSTSHGRAKTVITRSGARRRYCVPCFREVERYAHGEAPEEASAFVLLDACNGVEFQEQPARIEFDWYGGPTTHLPDILVAAGATKEFWECKKDHEAKDFLVRKRAERLRELLLPLGFGYRLVTTRDLAQRSYYPNAIAMRRFAKELGYNPEWIKAPSSIHGLQELPANEALSFVPEAQRLQALNSLLYSGHLRAQMCNPVTLSTPVLHVDPAKESNPWVWELFERTK